MNGGGRDREDDTRRTMLTSGASGSFGGTADTATEGADVAEMHSGVARQRRNLPRPSPSRIAILSVHTSPLHQPGTGDAGGMNVYIVEVSRRLAEVRRAGRDLHPGHRQRPAAGGRDGARRPGPARHLRPVRGAVQGGAAGQLCAFTNGVLRAEAARPPGYYDLIHSHYWLSGQVGWLAKERWGVPLIHTAHTLAKVKNARLADGDRPEPRARVIGEEQVVAEADRLIANTEVEARRPDRPVRRRPGAGWRWSSRVSTWTGSGRSRAERGDRAGPPPAAGSGCPAGVRRRVRRPDPAAQGPRRAAARRRRAARARPPARRGADRGHRRRSQRQWVGPADRADRARRPRSALAIAYGSCRRRPATTCRRCTGPPTSSRCRRTTSPSAWSRWRPRRAVRRWSPPRSAVWSRRYGTG